jgi:hypothetical protein
LISVSKAKAYLFSVDLCLGINHFYGAGLAKEQKDSQVKKWVFLTIVLKLKLGILYDRMPFRKDTTNNLIQRFSTWGTRTPRGT